MNPSGNKTLSSKRIRAKFYIFDMSNLIQISRDLADKYVIKSQNLEKLCQQNICYAMKFKRYDIVKVTKKLLLPLLNCT